MSAALKIFEPSHEADTTVMILPGVLREDLAYDQYNLQAMDGDLLLWEPRDAMGEIIAHETNGPFCHASGVVHVHGRPFQSAYAEGENGFLSPLSAEVRRNSGKISVFRVRASDQQRERVAAHLLGDLGGDYAWVNLGLIAADIGWLARAARHLPWLRREYDRQLALQSRKRSGAICSQHQARAWKIGGLVDFCPGKPLALISPNDIARSAYVHYVGTLTWPENWRS